MRKIWWDGLRLITSVFRGRTSHCSSQRFNMESNDLMKLSKQDLVEKIKALEKECRSLKGKGLVPTSKHEALVQKFKRYSGKRKKHKVFNPTSCTQRKIALKVAYFGWDLMGLQDNPGLDDTVEKLIFEALSHTKLLIGTKEESSYSKCGRTDKGVSAFSQVLCLNLRSRAKEATDAVNSTTSTTAQQEQPVSSTGLNDDEYVGINDEVMQVEQLNNYDCELDYCGILNRVLPPEIKVLAWAPADEDFNARFSCTGRVYKYFFPLGSLNIEAMDKAAKLFIGTHDFRNFCKMNVEERIVFVRDVKGFDVALHATEVQSPYQMCVATITATGFLYHQIRYMMAILFLIGMDFEEASIITKLLDVEKMPRRPQYGLMADYPLVLYDCHFENVRWNISAETSSSLHRHLQQFWANLAIKSTLAKSMVDKFSSENILPSTPSAMSGDSNKPYNTRCIKDFNISGFLLGERFTSKQYRRVVERKTGISLEEKIEGMENRKKRRLERLGVENDEESMCDDQLKN